MKRLISICVIISLLVIPILVIAGPVISRQGGGGGTSFSVTDITGQTDDTTPATTATAVLAQGGSLIESTLAEIGTAINPTAATLHIDDILTALGIASEAVNFGAFTGSTIDDNVTAKAAMQALETALELKQTSDSDLTTIAGLSPVENKIMIGSSAPAWSVSAYTLAAPGASGGLLQSDGTNWARVTSLTGLSFDIGDAVASGHAVTMDANGVLQTAFTALIPDAADGATLGATDREWSDLILADGAIIYGQNDQSNTITSSATGWNFNLPLGLYSANDPDVAAEGKISWDANGDYMRGYDGTRQVAIARVQEEIHVTVVKPQDMADAVRDAFLVWSNESGMTFTVTGWKCWAGADDTTLNIETTAADGSTNATVDAVECATGSGPYTGADTTITAGTISNGSLIWLDFDDTDDPSYVKLVIYGYYNADVN